MIRLSDQLCTAVMQTGSLKNRLDAGFLYLFSGTQPATADTAASGSLLAAFSIDGLGVTGLTFQAGDAEGQLKKTTSETWQATGLIAGTARWFRWQRLDTNETTTRANALLAGTSTLERLDGSVGTTGSDLVAASVAIAVGAPLTLDTFVITLPRSAS